MRIRTFLMLLILIGLGLGGVSGQAYLAFKNSKPILLPDSGPVGMWTSSTWTKDPHTTKEYVTFAEQLAQNKISDVFFQVGPLEKDGTISADSYAHAATMLSAVREIYPDFNAQAWIGQFTVEGGGPLDLSDKQVRLNILRTVTDMIDIGFDGIHYNFSPVKSGNPHLLDLLDNTLVTVQGHNRLLSIAADGLDPLPQGKQITDKINWPVAFWSKDYHAQIAERTDQTVVILSDTMMPTDWIFAWLVSWQTKKLSEIIGPDTTLFIGVPTHEYERDNFNPKAENMNSGLRGILMGLDSGAELADGQFGVAIYADWTTDDAEWQTFRELWLNEG